MYGASRILAGLRCCSTSQTKLRDNFFQGITISDSSCKMFFVSQKVVVFEHQNLLMLVDVLQITLYNLYLCNYLPPTPSCSAVIIFNVEHINRSWLASVHQWRWHFPGTYLTLQQAQGFSLTYLIRPIHMATSTSVNGRNFLQ